MGKEQPDAFRESTFDFNGKKLQIAGLAHPIRYPGKGTAHDYKYKLQYLKDKGYKALLSLDENLIGYRYFGIPDYESVRNEWTKNSHADDSKWRLITYPDPISTPALVSPTPDMYKKLFDYLEECIREDRPLAIHCGAGHGRTGTILAAIKLYEKFENLYNKNPEDLEKYDTTAKMKLAHPDILCTSGVYNAITEIRNIDVKSRGSVETRGQVQSLMNLEKQLLEKYKNKLKEAKAAELKKPLQFREVGIQLNGTACVVAGMAHPYHQENIEINDTFKYLKAQGYSAVVSLEKAHIENLEQDYCIPNGMKHEVIAIEDFSAPTVKDVIKLYNLVVRQAQSGKKVAIHCTSGNGRTGTMLAALLLMEQMEKFNKNNLEHLEKLNEQINTVSPRSNGMCNYYPCTSLVHEVINRLREMPNSGFAVETQAQVEFLNQLQGVLLNKKKTEGIARLQKALKLRQILKIRMDVKEKQLVKERLELQAENFGLRYQLEKIDPLHRTAPVLTEYYNQWLWSQDRNFWKWIGATYPNSAIIDKRLDFYDKDQRKKYLVKIKGGQLYSEQFGSAPIDTKHIDSDMCKGGVAFVMDKQGRIYLGQKIRDKRHHSSFLSGEQVIFAGMMKIDNGKITWINNNSGHYKPTDENFRNFIKRLPKDIFAPDATYQSFMGFSGVKNICKDFSSDFVKVSATQEAASYQPSVNPGVSASPPAEIAPGLFREIEYVIDGTKVSVAGHAHPCNGIVSTVDSVLNYLSNKNFGTIVSFDDLGNFLSHTTFINKWLAKGIGKNHISLKVPNNSIISINAFDTLYEAVKNSAKAGSKLSMHCNFGEGRTGTMMAALAIYEAMEKAYKDNPAQFANYHIKIDKFIDCKSENNIPCSKVVFDAITKARSKSQLGFKSIVGYKCQVESLIELERTLVARYMEKLEKEKLEKEKLEKEKLEVEQKENKLKVLLLEKGYRDSEIKNIEDKIVKLNARKPGLLRSIFASIINIFIPKAKKLDTKWSIQEEIQGWSKHCETLIVHRNKVLDEIQIIVSELKAQDPQFTKKPHVRLWMSNAGLSPDQDKFSSSTKPNP